MHVCACQKRVGQLGLALQFSNVHIDTEPLCALGFANLLAVRPTTFRLLGLPQERQSQGIKSEERLSLSGT